MIETESTELPLVSVVMPVRNEAAFIARSLGAVVQQDYPAHRLEVLVADGMSSDGTREEIARLAAACPRMRITIIDNPGRIAPTGINAAMPAARGAIIVRVDGHCEIAPDYVRRCVEHLQSGDADGVGGPITTIGQSATAEVIAVAMSSSFGVGGSAFRTLRDRTTLTDTIAFPAYTREIVERAGPYDEELVRNQDDEYNYRLRKLGARLLLAADVQSKYYSRSSLTALARQYFQYGYWKVRVLQKHPRQMRPRQFVPACFMALLLGLAAAAPFSRGAAYGLVILLGAYFSACAAATVLAARQLTWRKAPLLPLCFVLLHWSYGLGFLVGLVRFCRRWNQGELAAGSRRESAPPSIPARKVAAAERGAS